MAVDAWASWPHYADHIRPIWDLLPNQGTFWEPPRRPVGESPIIVASHHDLKRVKGRPVVFVEHGAGQTYTDSNSGGYAGGADRGHVSLFINPNERVHDANRKAYPQAKHVLAGSARVEWLRRVAFPPSAATEPPGRPAISFHWNCRVTEETKWAWPHYQDLPDHVDVSTVLGHGHPKAWRQLSSWWQRIGAEPVESFTEICRRASVYAVDNSSTLYEAAALDIPVVILNAPWYRRDVWHGLRFWEHLPGPMVEDATMLPRAFDEAPEWYEDRRLTTEAVYGPVEGAAERAAAAILDLFS